MYAVCRWLYARKLCDMRKMFSERQINWKKKWNGTNGCKNDKAESSSSKRHSTKLDKTYWIEGEWWAEAKKTDLINCSHKAHCIAFHLVPIFFLEHSVFFFLPRYLLYILPYSCCYASMVFVSNKIMQSHLECEWGVRRTIFVLQFYKTVYVFVVVFVWSCKGNEW